MNENKKTINRTLRFSKKEIEKIKKEIELNDHINTISDFIRESMNCYFKQKELKQIESIHKKVIYIDETTGINLLMMSDLIATQLKMSDKARLEYIQAKKEELEKIIRFDGTLY